MASPIRTTGFASLPFELYERIFAFLRRDLASSDSGDADAYGATEVVHLPAGNLVRIRRCSITRRSAGPLTCMLVTQNALPLICKAAHPAGQAALLHTASVPCSFTGFLSKHEKDRNEDDAALVRHLRITTDVPVVSTCGPAANAWLDTPRAFRGILDRCSKLETVHLAIRAGSSSFDASPSQPPYFAAWMQHSRHGHRQLAGPDGCRLLSVSLSPDPGGPPEGGSTLLGTLAHGCWHLRCVGGVRLECRTTQDLVLSSSPGLSGPARPRHRFISTDHLILATQHDSGGKVYYPMQFHSLLASLVHYPKALTVLSTRMDSAGLGRLLSEMGPALRYLRFAWSAYVPHEQAESDAQATTGSSEGPITPTRQRRRIVDYLYGSTYNPLLVGNVLRPCVNLEEVRLDIVDLVPLRGMRFPPSVQKLSVQWHILPLDESKGAHEHATPHRDSRPRGVAFFSDFFPWLQNHLCMGEVALSEVRIGIVRYDDDATVEKEVEENADGDREQKATRTASGDLLPLSPKLAMLLDDYVVLKATLELCKAHAITAQPPNLLHVWKTIRKVQLGKDEWSALEKRLQ
jgi:hypothetical protein